MECTTCGSTTGKTVGLTQHGYGVHTATMSKPGFEWTARELRKCPRAVLERYARWLGIVHPERIPKYLLAEHVMACRRARRAMYPAT